LAVLVNVIELLSVVSVSPPPLLPPPLLMTPESELPPQAATNKSNAKAVKNNKVRRNLALFTLVISISFFEEEFF
jgi:hypothetical protein